MVSSRPARRGPAQCFPGVFGGLGAAIPAGVLGAGLDPVAPQVLALMRRFPASSPLALSWARPLGRLAASCGWHHPAPFFLAESWAFGGAGCCRPLSVARLGDLMNFSLVWFVLQFGFVLLTA